jgi:hypothetical protein
MMGVKMELRKNQNYNNWSPDIDYQIYKYSEIQKEFEEGEGEKMYENIYEELAMSKNGFKPVLELTWEEYVDSVLNDGTDTDSVSEGMEDELIEFIVEQITIVIILLISETEEKNNGVDFFMQNCFYKNDFIFQKIKEFSVFPLGGDNC